MEGAAPGAIEKAGLQGPLWAQSSGQLQRRMVDGRRAEGEEQGEAGEWLVSRAWL